MTQQITIRLNADELHGLRKILESQCRISQNLLEIKSQGDYTGARIRHEEARLLMLMNVISQLPVEQPSLFGGL